MADSVIGTREVERQAEAVRSHAILRAPSWLRATPAALDPEAELLPPLHHAGQDLRRHRLVAGGVAGLLPNAAESARHQHLQLACPHHLVEWLVMTSSRFSAISSKPGAVSFSSGVMVSVAASRTAADASMKPGITWKPDVHRDSDLKEGSGNVGGLPVEPAAGGEVSQLLSAEHTRAV